MTDAHPAPGFSALPLSAATQDNLTRLGYLTMTPVQAATLPLSLAGRDLIARARTGSGKTAAFGLALLARLATPGDGGAAAVQGLVLCPTRELADQVAQELRRLARALPNLKLLLLCGGTPLRPQAESLARGAQVVVGTPGRVLDHLERGSLALDALAVLVLDEADRMLEMGFAEDIARVAARCPAARQTLLFSATYPDDIAALAKKVLRDPATVTLDEVPADDQIRQRFVEVREDERLHAVGLLLAHLRPASTLAFCNTRQRCGELVEVLRAQGVSAEALHGELDQRDRDQVLVRFANRSVSVLVATDVAARGLDIDGLAAVVNVDIAADPPVHVHRVGRTGRGDQAGWAYSLASLDEMGRVGRIEHAQSRSFEWQPLAALTPTGSGALQPPMRTLQILGGRKAKIRAGDVLGALTGDAGLAASQVGRISVNDFSTYVAVAREAADRALRALNQRPVKGKRVKARALD